MHDAGPAGGYPLDSSAAGGPQLEPTTPRPRGRPGRTARRQDTVGTRSTPLAPGPFYGALRRQDDQRELRQLQAATPQLPLARVGRTAGAGREAGAAPRSRIDSYTSLNNESLPLSRLAPNDQAGGVGPPPQSTRLLAQTGRDPPPAQRRRFFSR
jgi:hypothetical protein